MSKPRFLIDEDPPLTWPTALRKAAPGLDVLQVGDPGAAARDSESGLTPRRQALGRVVISRPKYDDGPLAAHYAAGRRTAGLMLVRNNFTLAVMVQKIVGYWTIRHGRRLAGPNRLYSLREQLTADGRF